MTYKYTQKSGEQVYNAWDHLGFRYIQIPECGEEFTRNTIAARVVHTNVPDDRDSTFTSSNEMLNDVYELLKRSSLYSIQNSFVDTPTREKGQFLQDSINISEASTSASYERAASKKAIEQFLASADRYWTGDEAGRYNSVYPNCDGKRDIPDFSLNVPYWVWNYYMTTGDKTTLQNAYPYIKATADYITKYINSSTGLVTQLGGGDGSPNSYQYGIVDWPAVGRFGYDWSGTKTGARTTVNMLSKRAFDVVALAAAELGKTADAEDMQSRSDSIKTAINEKLITANGVYCDGLNANGNQVPHASQHATSYALAFDVAPDDKISDMSDYVADMGMKQGPMTADILVKSLFNTNKNTAALKLITEPNDNGWAKEVSKDYTFTWEAWDANSTENSQSHGWGAAAAADILENFAGVTNLEPGARKVRIAPVYTDLTTLDASVSTERGNVEVSYTRSEKSYDIDITIPANMTADIVLPVIGNGKFTEKNGKANDRTMGTTEQTIIIGSGKYSFSYNGDITVLPEKVEYKEPLPEGIYGEHNADKKTYTWDIGESEASSSNGITYTDKNDYADLTVSLAKGDSLNEGILWGASSVRETNTSGQKNLGETKRYLLVEPKYDGTFSTDIAFKEASERKKNRVYCADLGLNADISSIALSNYSKDSTNKTTVGNDITSTNVTTKTINMTANHAYIIYTYQTGSTISSMSYTYKGEVIKPSTPPTSTPTIAPTSPSPTPSIKPSEKPSSNGKYMHISFDDVYACLKDITDNSYNSIFENSFFADLKPVTSDYNSVQNNSEEQLNFAGTGYLDNLHIPKETITDNSVNILWNSSSKPDIPDLAEYKVFVNGEEKAAVTTLGYTVNGLSSSTEYSITVQAVDNSGNVLKEDSVTVTTKEKSQIVNVLDYGAKGNGKVTDTYAIQKAINDCPENGTVYLPKGYIFYSGALFLKSNMTFKVDGILMGSSDSKDYPLTVTRWEGWKKTHQPASEWANTTADLPDNHYAHTSLLNAGTYDETDGAYNVGNIVICGSGQINGNGFKLAYNEGLNHKTGNGGIPYPSSPAIDQTIRGRLITLHNAQNVYIKDIQLAYGPSWTVHPIYCDSITFDNLDIISKGNGETGAADNICILNGDGIDPDSSTNVNIFNSHFYTGDDAVAVKSGRNKEGNDLNKSTAFIRITDCVSDGSKGGFAVGSENASGIKNALFQNLTIKNITLSHGIWFKTYWSRGGVSENVTIRDIDSQKPLAFVMNYATSENNPADSVPQYKNFTIENCNSSLSFEGFKAEKGHDGSVISDVTVRGCTKSGTIKYGRNFNIYGADTSKWDVSNSENINIYADGYMEDALLKVKNGAVKVYQVDNESKEISVFALTTSDDVLSEILSLCGGNQTYEFSSTGELSDGDTLTVTSQDGKHTEMFTISIVSNEMQVWDFAKYTTEVKTTESGFAEEYDGLTITIADNGADSDHDKITANGVYWRGGASSGESARYISFTPDKDGTLYATGKLNSSGGRWGISASLDVSSFTADSSSTTSTSTATVQMQCTAGTTYYIYAKTRSATVNSVSYMPK